jgi:hypothetical protein
MTAYIRAKHSDVSLKARPPRYEESQLLMDNTRNRLGDARPESPAGITGGRHSLPSQCSLATPRVCGVTSSVARAFFPFRLFLSHGLLWLNRKVIFLEA